MKRIFGFIAMMLLALALCVAPILAADFGPKCKPKNGPLTEANRRRCQKIAANEERREYGCLY